MKRLNFIMGLALSICIFSCDNDNTEDCGKYEKKDTLSGSIEGEFTGEYELLYGGDQVQKGYKAILTFDPLSENTSKLFINFLDSHENIKIYIDNPIILEGKPYDIVFNYEGIANILIGKNQYTDIPVSFEGWIKEHIEKSTRCSIGFGYDCEISLKYSLSEGEEYQIMISPGIYW